LNYKYFVRFKLKTGDFDLAVSCDQVTNLLYPKMYYLFFSIHLKGVLNPNFRPFSFELNKK